MINLVFCAPSGSVHISIDLEMCFYQIIYQYFLYFPMCIKK